MASIANGRNRRRILCIQLGFHKDYPDVSTLATTYNDGIYYVASFIKQTYPDAAVEMCQMFWGEDPLDFDIRSYDYIFISALATHFWSNIEVLEAIKSQRRPGAVIVMGGPHAAFAPYEALRYADFAVLAEGEMPSVQLIDALEDGGDVSEVDNIAYIDSAGKLRINHVKRYKAVPATIDPALLSRAPRLHWATVSMSRGCPFNCSFCYAIRLLGRQFRTKDIDAIRQELDGIYEQTGCNRFYVTDLNLTTRKDFCQELARTFRGAGYEFISMSRINHADDVELLRDMRESGFTEYCLGVESEDPDILQTFNKNVDASLQTERLLAFAENDIFIHSAIIFGLESQDRKAIERTAAWCAEARIVHPTFVCIADYPFQKLLFGSHQDTEDHRIIMETPTYQHYSFVGIFPRHMRPSALQQAILDSYDIFFERALEIEKKPQRRMRVKSYAKSVAMSRKGMERHIEQLKRIEAPYYTADGTLREDLLENDFENKYGPLREWLAESARGQDAEFVRAYAR